VATHIEGCPECRKFLERCVEHGLESLPAPPAELPWPDTVPQIDGFTIERELGRGAMGVVYLARRDKPRRQVALKLLPGGRLAGPGERRQWLREAEAASLVRHPNIVTVYEAVESDRWFLLVLEYIPGGTLADRLSGPLNPTIAARLMEAIARAVHHIHLCGQLHLDLKPSNILLDGEPDAEWEAMTPKVSDFGIARTAVRGATDAGGTGPGGTPSYMAPEQITKPRQDMTARADIHGLGAILYHMLTGRPPYQGATVLETVDLVQRQDPIPPRRLNPKIPSDLETICLKCLEKDPARRYPAAGLLADDLGRWQSGLPVSTRPVSTLGKSWRWCRRRPGIAALTSALALLALALSVSVVVITLLWRQAEANFRMSNDHLVDLVEWIDFGERHVPQAVTNDPRIPLLEKLKGRLLARSRSHPDDREATRRLDAVEICLRERLQQGARREKAQTILLESLANLDVLARRDPSDESIREILSRLHYLAELSEGMGNTDDSVVYLRRAIQLNEDQIRLKPSASGFEGLLFNRRALAWLLFRRGDREQARSLFAANNSLLETLPSELKALITPVQRFKADVDAKISIEGAPSPKAWKTSGHESDDAVRLSRLRSPTDDTQSPQEWARIAAQAIRSDDRADPATAARRESEDALNVTQYLTEIASTLRRVRDIIGAMRIGERITALGHYLVATYPDQRAAHLVLSEAYLQYYRNDWETKDPDAVETNMRFALGAAQDAFALESRIYYLDRYIETTRQAVYSLERRRLEGRPAMR